MSSPKGIRTESNLKMIGIDFYNTWITIASGCRKFCLYDFSAGGRGRLLVSSVPKREQKKKHKKNDEQGYFYQAGKCASVLGYENAIFFCRKRGMFFTVLRKRCE